MQLKYPITSDMLTILAIWSREVGSSLKACGVTNGQFLVLDCLDRNFGKLQTNRLALQLMMAPSLLSFLLAKLEQKSLITRNEDQLDRRKVVVELLAGGQSQLNTAWKSIHKVTSHLMQPMGEELLQSFLRQSDDYMRRSSDLRPNEAVYDGMIITNSVLAGEHQIKSLLSEYQMSFKEFRVLFELHGHHKGMHAKELAQHLLFAKPNVTDISKSLESKHLIIRTRDRYDHRSVNLEISNVGYKLITAIAPLVDKVIFDNSNNASAAEREDILQAFSLIVQAMRSKPIK